MVSASRPCSPWPKCFGAPYQVTGTPDNSLWEWSDNPSNGGAAIRTVPNGYTLWVGCQANDGPPEDGKYNIYPTVPSRTWDSSWDSGLSRFVWVYDWWMNTPPQQAAYDWYSWPDAAHHCNFTAPPPGSPPAPTSVRAVPTSSGNIHITWRDNTGGSANYVVRNGVTTSTTLPVSSTSYDWTVNPGTHMCFTVAAKRDGIQSPWSAPACTTTPPTPWCPMSDATHPTCSSAGAFQMDCATVACSTPTVDYATLSPDLRDLIYAEEAAIAYNAMGIGCTPIQPVLCLKNAQKFFGHYEDNTGTDLNFDPTVPYRESSGTQLSFSAVVNNTAKCWIGRVSGGASTFDSGYLDYPPNNGDGTPGSTADWNNDDWRNAVGHAFFRVTGSLQANGDWVVHLQLTSYYQFRYGVNFYLFRGGDMRRLEIIGWAENFRSIGNGALTFNASGSPRVPEIPPALWRSARLRTRSNHAHRAAPQDDQACGASGASGPH
jgi:hypothetical protein